MAIAPSSGLLNPDRPRLNVKPHIRRNLYGLDMGRYEEHTRWMCASGLVAGFGMTPRAAYIDWLRMRDWLFNDSVVY